MESVWYSSYSLLGAYRSLEEAVEHIHDPNVMKEYGCSLQIREIGVRLKKRLQLPHERVYSGGEIYREVH